MTRIIKLNPNTKSTELPDDQQIQQSIQSGTIEQTTSVSRAENYEHNEQLQQQQSKLITEPKGGLELEDYDLRPKFAALKHKPEFLISTNSSLNSHATSRITPSWFFNIPTTRSPFPDFGSKLPEEDDESKTTKCTLNE